MRRRQGWICAVAAAACLGGPGCDGAPAVVHVSGGVMVAPAALPPPDSDGLATLDAPGAEGAAGAPAAPAAIDFLALPGGVERLVVRADGVLERTAPGAAPLRIAADASRGLSVSADGNIVAYVRRGFGPETDIVVADLRVRGAGEVVTGWLGSEDEPALSADGARVAFVSGRSGIASIWVAPAARGGGAAAVQVTNVGLERAGRAAGAAPAGFLPPPENGSLRWETPARLTWGAGGRTYAAEVAP